MNSSIVWSNTLYKLLGVKSIKTSVYKPSSNGLVERMNRDNNRDFKKICEELP